MIILALATATVLVAGCFHFWKQLERAEKTTAHRHTFLNWIFKGLAIPILLWIFFNAGIFSKLPPLSSQFAFAPSGFVRIIAWVDLISIALFVVSSYWAMVTFGWLLARIFARTPERRDSYIFCGACAFFLVPIAGVILAHSGLGALGLAATLCLAPMVYGAIENLPMRQLTPMYSRAIAAMQFDKFDEAEAEVIKELEKCEDDFDGWMMLAELYATRFNDLKGAERAIHETCAQPNVNASQVGVAFHRLADWHLAIGENPAAARRALEEICRRFPNTHLDKMARLRIERMPSDRKQLIELRNPKTFHLPAETDRTAEARINRIIEKLQADPNDVSAREELAVKFVHQLNKAGLGIEQLELLIAMPEQPETKLAEWLGLIAAWQSRYLNDEPATRKTLERLLREYPKSPQAVAAQRRLSSSEV